MHRLLIVFLLTLVSDASLANYDFNANCRLAYTRIFALHFSEAQQLIDKETAINPDNLIPVLLNSQIDFYRAFIGERTDDFETFKKNADTYLDKIDNSGDKSSPYHNFIRSEIEIYSAFLNAKHKNFISAAFSVRKAYKLLEKNAETHPEFPLTYKNLGFLHAAIGSVPDKYQWLVKLIGMEGYPSQGVEEINIALYATEHNIDYIEFRNETLTILLSVQQRLEFNIEEADKLIPKFNLAENHAMINFFVIDYYMNTNRNDLAGEILNHTVQSKDQYPLHFLNYLRGSNLLFKLDSGAIPYFQSFIDNYTGFNFIKSAYQRIAWSQLIAGNKTAYFATLKKGSTNGETFTDEDKIADASIDDRDIPNVSLLKARLLFDGGYYSSALSELRKNRIDDFTSEQDRTELSYRFARIFDHIDDKTKAITYYSLTYQKGKDKKWFYAANSALHLGLLYEKENNFEKSLLFYNKCMALKDHDYENSIEQKARAGINRVNIKYKKANGIPK